MSKYTTGSWEADLGTGAIFQQGQYVSLAHVSINAESPKEGEANARLIAAAPELLEVLQRFANGMEIGLTHSWLSSVAEEAKAAIAKALGNEVPS